ncbi:hypothetical protein ACLOJK_035462 [Asimina triloba]
MVKQEERLVLETWELRRDTLLPYLWGIADLKTLQAEPASESGRQGNPSMFLIE